MSKTVPVVVYHNGTRQIVGEALVEEDGMVSAEISPEGFKILNLHADIRVGDFSIVEDHHGMDHQSVQEGNGSSEGYLGTDPSSGPQTPEDSERIRLVRQVHAQQPNPVQPK